MRRIVVAAKAGADQPWLAEAAAEIAQQQGASVDVVSADGLDIEAFSTIPREEAAGPPRDAAEAMAEQIRAAGAEARPHVLHGPAATGVLLFAEQHDAVVPLTEIVELVNIGTLFAFLVVNIGKAELDE